MIKKDFWAEVGIFAAVMAVICVWHAFCLWVVLRALSHV